MGFINDFLDKQISIADQLNLFNLPKIDQPTPDALLPSISKVQSSVNDKRKARRKGATPYGKVGGGPFLSKQSEYFINIYQYNFFLDIINCVFMIVLNNIKEIREVAEPDKLSIVSNFLKNSMILSFFLNTEFYNNDYDFISEPESISLYNKFFFIGGTGIFPPESNIKTQAEQTQNIKLIIDTSIANVIFGYLSGATSINLIVKFNEEFQKFSSLYPHIDALFKITETMPPPPPLPGQPVQVDSDEETDNQLYTYLDLYFGTLKFPYREEERQPSIVYCISDISINEMCDKIKHLFLGLPKDFVQDPTFEPLCLWFIQQLVITFQQFKSVQDSTDLLIDQKNEVARQKQLQFMQPFQIPGPTPAIPLGSPFQPIAVQGGKIKYKKSKKIKKNRKTKKNKKLKKNRKTKKKYNKRVKKNKTHKKKQNL